MSKKLIVMFLVLASLLLSGCMGEEQAQDDMELADGNISEGPISETGESEDHPVRMEYYEVMIPSTLDIDSGDTVSWRNYKQQGSYVLVSDDSLFEEQELFYRHSFSYTFDEAGSYMFHADGLPHMNVTINVN